MTLQNLSAQDMATIKWAIRNLRLEVRTGNASSHTYTKDQVIEECNHLEEIIRNVTAEYYEAC